MFFIIVLAIITLAAVVYIAVSKKSSFKMRIAALGALGLMIISVVVSLFFVLRMTAAPPVSALPDAALSPDNPPPPVTQSNGMVLIMFIVFLIILFLVVLSLSFREHRRGQKDRAKDA